MHFECFYLKNIQNNYLKINQFHISKLRLQTNNIGYELINIDFLIMNNLEQEPLYFCGYPENYMLILIFRRNYTRGLLEMCIINNQTGRKYEKNIDTTSLLANQLRIFQTT